MFDDNVWDRGDREGLGISSKSRIAAYRGGQITGGGAQKEEEVRRGEEEDLERVRDLCVPVCQTLWQRRRMRVGARERERERVAYRQILS